MDGRTKYCPKCGLDLPHEKFTTWNNGRSISSYCRKCDTARKMALTRQQREEQFKVRKMPDEILADCGLTRDRVLKARERMEGE